MLRNGTGRLTMIQQPSGEFSVGSWLAQSVAVYVIPLALDLVLAGWVTSEVLNYIFLGLLGSVLGLVISRLFPVSTESGRWVWAGPVVLLVCGVLWEMSLRDFDILTVLFGTGEAGWANVLITSPALACCCYSVAMEWRTRRKRSFAGTADKV